MSESDLRDAEGEDVAAPAPDVAADPEAPEADVVEQRTAVSDLAEADRLGAEAVPDEVDPADRVEQERVVAIDEDDYR